MIRRSTIVYVVLGLALVGASYYLNNRKENPVEVIETPIIAAPTEEEISFLFTSADGAPNSIHLEAKTGEVVELTRNADNVWALTLPIATAAEQTEANTIVGQLATIFVLNRLQDIAPQDVGLDDPQYTLTVNFGENNVERIVYIGVVTPTESGYYVSLDDEIMIISKSAIDSLIGLLTTPPYAETPTPSPTPVAGTETPLPSTPEAVTATPTATVTP